MYKNKALQSPFPAFGALQLVLDPGAVAVEFCLTSSSTGEWYNDNGRNFRIELGASAGAPQAPAMTPTADSFSYAAPTYDLSASPPPPPPVHAPAAHSGVDLSEGMDILCSVAAYLKWEQLGKPQVTELQRSDSYAGAVNVINKRLDDGETIDALEREYGLPPGLVKKTAMEAAKKGASAPPPPPRWRRRPRPCRRRRRRFLPRRPTPSSPPLPPPPSPPPPSSPPPTSRACANSARVARCTGARSSTWATAR